MWIPEAGGALRAALGGYKRALYTKGPVSPQFRYIFRPLLNLSNRAVKMAAENPPQSVVFCLDSSAITHGANLPPAQCRTASSVLEEFQPGGATRRRLDLLLAGGMSTAAPSPAARKRVTAAATAAGSGGRLSAPDQDVLALCLDLGPSARLVSDDYTMLDVAKRLGIASQTVATKGITDTRSWNARCSGCGRTYGAERAGQDCDVCGREIRLRTRRP